MAIIKIKILANFDVEKMEFNSKENWSIKVMPIRQLTDSRNSKENGNAFKS